MEKEFVPYNLSLKLKELGFDERCLAGYYNDGKSLWFFRFHKNSEREPTVAERFATAPLWQQVFDWFREKHNLFSTIAISGADDYQIYIHDLNNRNKLYFKDMKEGYFTKVINFCYKNKDNIYEEARLACLEKLIELCEKKQ